MTPGTFDLQATDPASLARAGTLHTSHGAIPTPCFMPVGTQGTVKAVSPLELRELQAPVILGNTYHLLIRPGMDTIRTLNGLHHFTGWHGPILTDSGGFQIFSLSKLRHITEEGAHFQSHVDGTRFFLGPKESIQIQQTLGSDIMMAFDECPPWPATEEQVRAAVDRTLRWIVPCISQAAESHNGHTPNQLLFGIVQGGSYEHLRAECAQAMAAHHLPGYAIGGVSVGEPEEEMFHAVESTIPHLPHQKPRYAMGLGQPHQLVQMVSRGVDMFDCVLPTRVARNGTAYTANGVLHMKNAAHSRDPNPIEEGCRCYACQNFSRAYIRHLLKCEEILGLRLITLHNLHFFLELMRRMRSAILEGTFATWSNAFLQNYQHRKATDDILD